MNRLVSIIIIFIFLIPLQKSYGQKSAPVEKLKSEVKIDGKSDDWPLTLRQIPKSPYIYFLAQKGENLILGIEIADPVLQQQILIAGLTVWINEKGKKKPDIGIRYPRGLPEDQIPKDPEVLRERREQISKDKKTILAGLTSLELVNFYGEGELTWGSNDNPDGIQTQINFDENFRMVYEASIPLSIIFKNLDELKKAGKKGFVLGFESGVLPRPNISGDLGVGVSGGSLSNPSRPEGNWARGMQQQLEDYRKYTLVKKGWTQKYYLPKE